jgi:hypothetical protein
MTYTPKPDREDVLYHAHNLGPTGHFYRQLPDWVSTSTTGGGTVSQDLQQGYKINPGTTSGDTANVTGAGQYHDTGMDVVVTEILYSILNPSPPTNYFKVGALDNAASDAADGSIGIDLYRQQYEVGSNTETATLPGNASMTLLRIKQDYDAGQTVIEQKGGVDESVTFNTSPNAFNGDMVVSESRGNDSKMSIFAYRRYVTPEK